MPVLFMLHMLMNGKQRMLYMQTKQHDLLNTTDCVSSVSPDIFNKSFLNFFFGDSNPRSQQRDTGVRVKALLQTSVSEPCCMNAELLFAVVGDNILQGRQFQEKMGSNAELLLK